jgi:hypothetical protein
MNIQFEVTLRGFGSNSINRFQDLLKDFYWSEAPEDWKQFDGDIDIKYLQPTNGDRALIEVSQKWTEWTFNFLKKNPDVRRVEIRYTNLSKDFIRKNKRLDNYPENYYEGNLIQM